MSPVVAVRLLLPSRPPPIPLPSSTSPSLYCRFSSILFLHSPIPPPSLRPSFFFSPFPLLLFLSLFLYSLLPLLLCFFFILVRLLLPLPPSPNFLPLPLSPPPSRQLFPSCILFLFRYVSSPTTYPSVIM